MNTENKDTVSNSEIVHGIVYLEEGRFGGWPANHGMWYWDKEILVGFVEARHKDKSGHRNDQNLRHSYDRSTARDKYARSKDGGITWSIEDAYTNGQTGFRYNNQLPAESTQSPVSLKESIDFSHSDLTLTFLRETNFGPTHFYYSYDKGNVWKGPFIFPNLGTNGVASRTDYIIEGEKELNAFITLVKSDGKQGKVAMVKTTDGGLNWEIVSFITPEHEGFDIMPSSLRLSKNELITSVRTRKYDSQDLITIYLSEDNGKTWNKLKSPLLDTGRKGSPPTLLKLEDARLALAYVHRSEYGSRVNIRFSNNNGRNWSDEIILRCCDGANHDVGYPRMIQRPDGKLVLIYYWNNVNLEGSKPYRYIAYTILNPDNWK